VEKENTSLKSDRAARAAPYYQRFIRLTLEQAASAPK
jgi:hypothetical protein